MSHDHTLHAALIGKPGGAALLRTPVLVLDRAALERNLAKMAALTTARGRALRPHAKTHKCATIARMQIAAGAVGVCVAKLGEAEAFADAGGIDDILVTSPVAGTENAARVAALHCRLARFSIVVDHPDGARELAAASQVGERPLPVLIDVDPGIHRTGVAGPGEAVALARAIAGSPALRLAGVQFYCGGEQHVADLDRRRERMAAANARLAEVLKALRGDGHAVPVVTGGGTGTLALDLEAGVLSELQAGSYVMMDAEYQACDFPDAARFETALFLDATIISANMAGLGTLDAGFKALAADAAGPGFARGAPDGARFIFMGDEHGGVIAPGHVFARGDRIRLVTPHCDPTVNLHDHLHVIDGEVLTAIWPIEARGRSR